jgi:hypothetical protein
MLVNTSRLTTSLLTTYSRRIAYLALFALLFGNVAGWLHVAVSHHHGPIAAQTEATAEKLIELESGRQSQGCSCSHHHCDRPSSEQTDRSNADSSPESTPCEHDSDRCSVCQAFLVNRNGTTLPPAASVFSMEQPARRVRHETHPVQARSSLGSISVRGPPLT